MNMYFHNHKNICEDPARKRHITILFQSEISVWQCIHCKLSYFRTLWPYHRLKLRNNKYNKSKWRNDFNKTLSKDKMWTTIPCSFRTPGQTSLMTALFGVFFLNRKPISEMWARYSQMSIGNHNQSHCDLIRLQIAQKYNARG